MGLLNAQPRFGYDAEDNTIFDYLASRSIKVGGIIESVDGQWDSVALVHLIKTGQPVEGARLAARDKVEQANRDFIAEPLTPDSPALSVAPGQSGGEPAAIASDNGDQPQEPQAPPAE